MSTAVRTWNLQNKNIFAPVSSGTPAIRPIDQ
jgi:hypothetical protein